MTSHREPTSEFVEAMKRLDKLNDIVDKNSGQIAELRSAIAETNLAVSRTHEDVVKLERKADQLISLMTHSLREGQAVPA